VYLIRYRRRLFFKKKALLKISETDPRRRKQQACHHGGHEVQACFSNPHSPPIWSAGVPVPIPRNKKKKETRDDHQEPKRDRNQIVGYFFIFSF